MLEDKDVKIIHSLPGRLRIFVSGLKYNYEYQSIVEKYFINKIGVKKVITNLYTGKVLIIYNPGITSKKNILFNENPLKKEAAAASSEELSVLNQKAPVTPIVYKAIPYALLGYIVLKNLRKSRISAVNSAVNFFVYPDLLEGLFLTYKNRRLDSKVLSGGSSLLALRLGNIPAAVGILILSKVLPKLNIFKEEIKIENSAKQLTALSAVGAGISYFGYKNSSSAISSLTAGLPVTAGLTSGLPLFYMQKKGVSQGYYIQNMNSVKKIENIDYLIFTDVASVCEEQKAVNDIISLKKGIETQDILSLAGGLYLNKNTKTSRAILSKVKEWNIPVLEINKVSGNDILKKAIVDNKEILIGSKEQLNKRGVYTKPVLPYIWKYKHLQKYLLLVSVDKEIVGFLVISDLNISSARTMIEKLRSEGVSKIGLLSTEGEKENHYGLINLGFEPLKTGISIEEQIRILEDLKRKGKKIVVVGDKESDINLLRRADLGICFYDSPQEVINNSAVVLNRDNKEGLNKFIFANSLSRNIIKQNYNILAVQSILGTALGVSRRLTPKIGLVFPLTTFVLTIYNSKRLNNYLNVI